MNYFFLPSWLLIAPSLIYWTQDLPSPKMVYYIHIDGLEFLLTDVKCEGSSCYAPIPIRNAGEYTLHLASELDGKKSALSEPMKLVIGVPPFTTNPARPNNVAVSK